MPVFVVYRLMIAAYNLTWLIYNIYLKGAKMFIYISNWSYTLFVVYFTIATILSCIEKCNDLKKELDSASGESDKETPEDGIEMKIYDVDDDPVTTDGERDALAFGHKLLWFLHTISATGGLWVTVGYWGVSFEDGKVDADNLTKEVFSSVFVLMDTCLSLIPVRVVHFVYALLYLAVYLLFSVVYWKLGGTNIEGKPYIYKVLNYDDFKAITGVVLVVLLIVGVPLLHLFVFGITKFRDYLHTKYHERKKPYTGIYRMISIIGDN